MLTDTFFFFFDNVNKYTMETKSKTNVLECYNL